MTATREERLEVAERLMEYSHALGSDTCDEFYTRLNLAIFGDGGLARPDRGIFRRLADLIDPTCRMTNTSSCNGLGMWGCVCSACGANIEYLRAKSINYCPHCGARVVND